MTKKEIQEIKLRKRWPFNISDIFERYFFIIFPLGILMCSYFVLDIGLKKNQTDVKVGGFIFFLMSMFLTLFVIKRLYENQIFKVFKIRDLTNEKIEASLKKCGFESFKYYKTGYYSVLTKTSWFSWGENITIIPNGDEILINSQPTGSLARSQPITISKDKKNIEKLISELKKG